MDESMGKILSLCSMGYKMPLEAHGTTSPVFESFTVPAFKELEGGENYIIIRAEAVQTEGCLTLDDAARKLGITSDIYGQRTAISENRKMKQNFHGFRRG